MYYNLNLYSPNIRQICLLRFKTIIDTKNYIITDLTPLFIFFFFIIKSSI